MRLAARTDANQAVIVDALRSIGASVETSTARLGGGFPDLCVGYCGANFLIEVKNPETRGKLNKKQREWIDEWQGQHVIVETVTQALRAVGAI